MHAYRLNGVVLGSDAQLTTLAAADDSAPELLVRRRALPDAEREPLYTIPYAERPDPFLSVARGQDGYFVRAHGIADFLIAPGSIDCAPLPDAPPASIEQVLVDQIVPRAMQLIGRPCFHASAVWLDGIGAVAFVGPSGAGKSTLCAALCRLAPACRAIISDDSLALRQSPDGIVALPGYPSVRLWPDSARAIANDAASLPRATPRTAKLRMRGAEAPGPSPLRRIFALDRGRGGAALRAEPIAPARAFAELSRSLHRLAPDDRTAMRVEFSLLGQVAARVPMDRLTVPGDLAALPAAAELVLRWV